MLSSYICEQNSFVFTAPDRLWQIRLWLPKQGHNGSRWELQRSLSSLYPAFLAMRIAHASFISSRVSCIVYTDRAVQSWIFCSKKPFLPWVISEAVKYQLFTGKKPRFAHFWTGVTWCGRAAIKLQLSHHVNYSHLNDLLVQCNQLGTLLQRGQIRQHYSALLSYVLGFTQ